jgi:hypothetical protein
MLFAPIVLLELGLALGVCLLALWQGETAERLAAGLLIAALSFTTILGKLAVPGYPLLELIADGLTALGFLALTLRYGNLWLGGAMLFYAAQFTLHSYYLVTDRPNDLFHATVNNLDFVGVVLCMAVGTVTAIRRRLMRGRAAKPQA